MHESLSHYFTVFTISGNVSSNLFLLELVLFFCCFEILQIMDPVSSSSFEYVRSSLQHDKLGTQVSYEILNINELEGGWGRRKGE